MEVVSLSKESGCGMVRSPEQMLEEALAEIRDDDSESFFKSGKKMMVISLNTNDDEYHVSWMQAGMKMSECVALCEVAKTKFIGEMHHVVTPENVEQMLEP